MKEQLDADRTKASVLKANQKNTAPSGGKSASLGAPLSLNSSQGQKQNTERQEGGGKEAGGKSSAQGGMVKSLTQKMAAAGGPSGQALGAALGGGEASSALVPLSKEALKYSWLNLIDSVGLTFLYLILHFVVRYIAGSKIVCRFGEEGAFGLVPKEAQTAISSVSGEEGAVSKGSEYAEIIVFGSLLLIISTSLLISFLALICPFIILGAAGIGAFKLIF